MAGLGEVRTSTQDISGGTQVAVCTNELDGTGALQATVPVGNKTTFAETGRTGLTSADTATTDLTSAGFGTSLVDCGNCLSLAVRATCDTASKSLTGRVIFYDGSGNPIGFSESLTFSSDPSLTIGASGQKYPSQRLIVDCGAARQCKFYVDSLTGTTWNVYVRPI